MLAVAALLLPAVVGAMPLSPGQPLASNPDLGFGTYLGGALDERLVGIGVDGAGSVYVVGTTASSDFPIVPSVPHPVPPPKVTFLGKLDPTGSTLLSSVVLAGFTSEVDVLSSGAVGAAVVDAVGNVYLTGSTSGGLPTLNAAQATPGGKLDAFVAKIDAAGVLVFSTYLGGSGHDLGTGIAVDGAGRVHVVGTTDSGADGTTPFPVLGAAQPRSGGGQDAFVAQLDATGAVQYATYLGGSGGEGDPAIVTSTGGDTWVAGRTSSPDLPTTPDAWRPASEPGPFLRSSDGGETWAPSLAPLREPSITALAVDPSDPTTVYAGTSRLPGGATGRGAIYRSTDGGSRWSAVYVTPSPTIGVVALAVDVVQPETLYAATRGETGEGNVLRSRDAGAHWEVANTGLPGGRAIIDLVVDPQRSGSVYAVVGSPRPSFEYFSGLYRTDDGGDRWAAVAVPESLTAGAVNAPPGVRGILAIDATDSNHLVLAAFQRVAQSFDRGQTWTVAGETFGACFRLVCRGIGALALDPTDPQVIYVGGTFGGIAKTTDGGRSWTRDFGCLQGPDSLLVDPQHPATLYAVAGALLRSVDGGASWSPLELGLGGFFEPNALVLAPGPSTRLYAGFTRPVSEEFVTRLDGAGTPVFSTYTGLFSQSLDPPGGLAVDQAGSVYLPTIRLDPTGMPQPFAIPVDPTAVRALEIDAGGTMHVLGQDDDRAFVMVFDPARPETAICSSLAGSAHDVATALAVNADGDSYVGMTTNSTNLATPGAAQPTNGGGTDAFVTRIAVGAGTPLEGCPAPPTPTTTLPFPSCVPSSTTTSLVTTTTVTTTTTTSLPPPSCGASPCGDGLSGAQCHLDRLLACPLCDGETVDAKVRAFITRKVSRAQVLIGEASAFTARKRRRALRRADRLLAAVQKKIRRNQRRGVVSTRCGDMIRQEILPSRQMVQKRR